MKRNRGGARLAMGLLLGPTDARNERYEELMHNLSWNFSAAEFPSKFTLLEQGNRVFAKHPNTTFIALHVANWPENLDAVSDWLKKYVEFGARQGELGRQPHRAAKFFDAFQDRIYLGRIPSRFQKCMRTTSAGSRQRMSTSLIGDIRDKVGGRSTVWHCRTKFWKRCITKM